MSRRLYTLELRTVSTRATTRRLCSTGATTAGGSPGRGNFFAYLSLPKSPVLSVVEVQRRYHLLQRRLHPDLANVQMKEACEGTGEEEVPSMFSSSGGGLVSSVDDSTYANLSYETLRDPFLRCKYLSRLTRAELVKGGPLSPAEEEALMSDDDRRSVSENQKLQEAGEDMTLSQEFLADMMRANECIFDSDGTEAHHRELLLLVTEME
ncbi:putative chaperone protein DNAj [Trypanosoma vivax]|nr:putative chaperone protein DNAj [Trypanosoma vivax]